MLGMDVLYSFIKKFVNRQRFIYMLACLDLHTKQNFTTFPSYSLNPILRYHRSCQVSPNVLSHLSSFFLHPHRTLSDIADTIHSWDSGLFDFQETISLKVLVRPFAKTFSRIHMEYIHLEPIHFDDLGHPLLPTYACLLSSFNFFLSSKNTFLISFGIVNTIWRCGTSKIISCCLSDQSSVYFLPHLWQKRLLQVKQTKTGFGFPSQPRHS